MRLADSFPQNANAKLHIIFQISITFTAKIDINGIFLFFATHYNNIKRHLCYDFAFFYRIVQIKFVILNY